MSEGLNKVMLFGNLGSDPELRVTQQGMPVLSLRLASNERVKSGDGYKDHTEWHSVTVFGKRGEALAKFLSKGASLFVEGHLRTTSWDDKQSGQKRYKTEIVADNVILGGRETRADRPAERVREPHPDDFDADLAF